MKIYFMWQYIVSWVLFVSKLLILYYLSNLEGHLSISDGRHKEQGLRTRIPLWNSVFYKIAMTESMKTIYDPISHVWVWVLKESVSIFLFKVTQNFLRYGQSLHFSTFRLLLIPETDSVK